MSLRVTANVSCYLASKQRLSQSWWEEGNEWARTHRSPESERANCTDSWRQNRTRCQNSQVYTGSLSSFQLVQSLIYSKKLPWKTDFINTRNNNPYWNNMLSYIHTHIYIHICIHTYTHVSIYTRIEGGERYKYLWKSFYFYIKY